MPFCLRRSLYAAGIGNSFKTPRKKTNSREKTGCEALANGAEWELGRLMRVLVISHACSAPINREKLKALARRPGLEVSALVPRIWKAGERVYQTESFQEDGVRLFAGNTVFSGHVGGHFYRNGLIRALRASRPDVVHLEEEPWSFTACQTLGTLMFFRPRPAVVTFSWDNLDFQYAWYYRALENWVLSNTDLLVAGGVTSNEKFLRQGIDPSRIETLYQFGLDPELYHPPKQTKRPETFTIGFVGRLVSEKGVDLLIRSLGQLEGHWHAMILGDGPMREELYALAASLGISDRIEFRGWVDHDEVPSYLRKIHALVLPSRTTPIWAEQFGHVLIEAMSSGAVPVGSSSGEIPHVIGKEGMIFPEEDSQALSDSLRRLRDEPGLLQQLSSKGRQRIIREFSWDVLAEKTHKLYEYAVSIKRFS